MTHGSSARLWAAPAQPWGSLRSACHDGRRQRALWASAHVHGLIPISQTSLRQFLHSGAQHAGHLTRGDSCPKSPPTRPVVNNRLSGAKPKPTDSMQAQRSAMQQVGLQGQARSAAAPRCLRSPAHRAAVRPFTAQRVQQRRAHRAAPTTWVLAAASPAASGAAPAPASSNGSEVYDTVVVGAGVSGLTTALVSHPPTNPPAAVLLRCSCGSCQPASARTCACGAPQCCALHGTPLSALFSLPNHHHTPRTALERRRSRRSTLGPCRACW